MLYTRARLLGVYVPKPQQIKAAPDNLHVGGETDFITTTQEVYKGKFGPRANKFKPTMKPIIQRGPLMAETQNMADFTRKKLDKVKAVEPAQPTIDLKFDNR